jgi:hypothetical protein
LSADDHLASRVDAVHLEHWLRDVQIYGRDRSHHGFPSDSAGDTIIAGGGVQAGHSALGHERAELPKLELSTEFPRLGFSWTEVANAETKGIVDPWSRPRENSEAMTERGKRAPHKSSAALTAALAQIAALQLENLTIGDLKEKSLLLSTM